jgi:ABC-2 type transport system ATP-binding protein
MQQRIGIAQALLNYPELVILDEPSIGLDPVGMVEVRELVKEISKEGRTVFLSSHLLFEVEQICDNVTIINKGSILASDTVQVVSHMFSGPSMIQLEIVNLTSALISAVEKLPFVAKVYRGEGNNSNSLTIHVTSQDSSVPVQVSKEITNAGGIIVGMNQKVSTLEDVFIQLVGGGIKA